MRANLVGCSAKGLTLQYSGELHAGATHDRALPLSERCCIVPMKIAMVAWRVCVGKGRPGRNARATIVGERRQRNSYG